MDASELINLKNEVATVETALQADPHNDELVNLKAELLELISLTESLVQQEQQLQSTAAPAVVSAHTEASPALSTPSAASSPISGSNSGLSSPSVASKPISASSLSGLDPSKQPIYQPAPPPRHWSVGDRCRALYVADGKFYEATILSIGGSGQIFSVQFKGYEASPPAMVGPEDLKAPHETKNKYQQKHQNSNNMAVTSTVGGVDADKGAKKRGPDGAEATGGIKKKKGAGGASEQVQKQMAWQNFAKGGAAKKGGAKAGAPILKKSIFATPDNPEGKVGVVGSGKGMTQFQQRGKHVYGSSSDGSNVRRSDQQPR